MPNASPDSFQSARVTRTPATRVASPAATSRGRLGRTRAVKMPGPARRTAPAGHCSANHASHLCVARLAAVPPCAVRVACSVPHVRACTVHAPVQQGGPPTCGPKRSTRSPSVLFVSNPSPVAAVMCAPPPTRRCFSSSASVPLPPLVAPAPPPLPAARSTLDVAAAPAHAQTVATAQHAHRLLAVYKTLPVETVVQNAGDLEPDLDIGEYVRTQQAAERKRVIPPWFYPVHLRTPVCRRPALWTMLSIDIPPSCLVVLRRPVPQPKHIPKGTRLDYSYKYRYEFARSGIEPAMNRVCRVPNVGCCVCVVVFFARCRAATRGGPPPAVPDGH